MEEWRRAATATPGGRVELRELRYFIVLAEELHLGRAARRLHLTHQGLSAAMNRLERSTGAILLVRGRGSHGVELTDAGAGLLPRAQDIVTRADAALAQLETRSATTARRFVVGLLAAGAAELNVPIVRHFRRLHPELIVEVRRLPYGAHTDVLSTGAVHALLGPSLALPEGARSALLFTDRRVAVLPSRHPLADAHHIQVTDLLDEPTVGMPGLPQRALDQCLLTQLRNGASPRPAQPGNGQVESGLNAVGAGLGVATIAASAARCFRRPDVAARPLSEAPPSDIVVMTHKHPHPQVTSLATQFANTAVRTARDLVGLVLDTPP